MIKVYRLIFSPTVGAVLEALQPDPSSPAPIIVYMVGWAVGW